ncbi:F-box At1g67390 [Olea europaea subsp. europaea]|uniref:F-box At1g67390 n=1 Tax=Olea europaea subsp. europaea TaxID=158383 RepID=A0A8S0RKB6_OLEEU|nr:F-box At1g67390 [Olea europaea subsp. europaea]
MGSSSKNAKQELDRISNLPEPIRCQIISMLPIEELVRTSILSKRWQHSWKQVPNLYFDLTQMTKACREFIFPIRQFGLSSSDPNSKMLTKHLCSAARLVKTILNCHSAPVTSCRILQCPIGFQDPIKSVEYLIRGKGVQEISLSGLYLGLDSYRNKNPPVLPSWGKTLQVLELSKYPLDDASIFRGCDSLQTLRLKFVELGNETLDEILANCKDLKELSLSSCTGVMNLMIRDTNLKILELRKLCLRKINIHAESLAVLVLDDILCPTNCLIIEAPAVVKFESFCSIEGETISYRRLRDCIEMEEIFSRCSGILGSCNNVGHALATQTCYITPFKKLQMLSASLDLNNIREAIILSYFFQECSGLQHLRICSPVSVENLDKLNQDSGNHLSYPDYLFWQRKETFFSIEKNLNAVWVKRFGGREIEMEFAKYIITRAPKMKSMIIECVDNCTADALSLLNLPRASKDLSLVLKHPSLSSGTSGCG